ncbi:YeeE/YedE family protein [Roseivivax sp. CAU 1761]
MELDTATAYTPWASLFGGILIGLSSVMVMVLLGKIAGISGITKGLIAAVVPQAGGPKDQGWRIAFICGLLGAPLVYAVFAGQLPQQTVSDNLLGMMVAGLLVGLGTAIGSGCTSGHGVSGLARLSKRSLAAVLTFVAAAALAVFVLRHVI